ncbi:hypothetical protein BD769DRAFT_96579 [Suillus cothurnatus]|nr:hypothetical protein BD769DRAFT_96579 [Suillus cothurnatus]
MSYPTSVTAVPTTIAPTTSSPPTTTSTFSSSSANSNNAPTSATPATTRTTPITTSMTSVATTLPTTITSTYSFGSTTIITTGISTSTPVAAPTPSPVSNSSNIGAIVGGVVGGVVVILALLGLFIFCLRRRRRRHESAENSNPERIVPRPQIDLGEETEITPYPDHGGSMRQYGESLRPPPGAAASTAAGAGIHHTTSPLSSPSQYSDTATSPGEGYPSQGFVRPGPGQYPQGEPNMYAMRQADWHTPQPLTSPAPSASYASASSSSRGMKERDTAAAARRQGLSLPRQQEVVSEGSGVVQHHDAGQTPSEVGGELSDVPPAYESIRQ